MSTTLVLYPAPGMGHLVSMVELGKFITAHHPQYQIVILTVTPPFSTTATAAYVKSVAADTTAITFHSLPAVTLPLPLDSYTIDTLVHHLLYLSIPHVREFMQSLSSNSAVSAFIVDMFCSSALSISGELNIPGYFFFTSGANSLSTLMYLPTLDKSITKSYKDMEAHELLNIPGVPPTPPADMMLPVLDRNGPGYGAFLELADQLTRSSGIIINTFNSMESKVLEAISSGKCVPDGNTPPLFCVGPLIAKSRFREGVAEGRDDCLKWLDMQPEKSVVFLCFGSFGVFTAEQLKEIAVGLERSGKRFVWAVRTPPSKDKSGQFLPPPEPDMEALLPEGFLERTKNQGFVVKSWAPQVEILNHGSVGGFVTHCGWNSVLEAVCAGVPMVAWPLYAEQRLNRLYLVEGLGVALPLKEEEGGGFVAAEEVEKQVREMMDGENGRLMRERVHGLKEAARLSMITTDGTGSSLRELDQLVDSWN